MTAKRYTAEEMKGATRGHLTLIEMVRKPNSTGVIKSHWKCRCVCGKEVVRTESHLNYAIHKGATPSCGCIRKGAAALGSRCSNWTGCGELGRTHYGVIKTRCRKNGLAFAISIEYLWDLYVQQGGRCALSGVTISFATPRECELAVAEKTASLDRIDSSKGYVEGNVQWVHKDVNLMKNHFPQEYFVETCRLIAEKHPEPATEAATAA